MFIQEFDNIIVIIAFFNYYLGMLFNTIKIDFILIN